MKKLVMCVLLCSVFSVIYAQGTLVGGPCEGCEAVFEYGDIELSPVDTLPEFGEWQPGLKITGTIYQNDGETPAQGVILYVYHTNNKGVYPTSGNEEDWARRHGYIRGWIKTGADGRYTFYTAKPGTYPSRNVPAHIHPTILEPNGRYYWIAEYLFSDDPLVSDEERSNRTPRGGSSGVLTLRREGNLLVGERDIILGKNVPSYD